MSEDVDPLLGAVLGGKYRVDAYLGSGAMGDVYRGEQLSLRRRVAVKVMRPAQEGGAGSPERFRREALAVARLRHPNIVAVYDFGLEDGIGAYLVMECLEGRSLRDEVQARGPLPAAEERYLMAHEWARTADDVLWRRSKLGLTLEAADRRALVAFMAASAGRTGP